jgi:hypothetical protein
MMQRPAVVIFLVLIGVVADGCVQTKPPAPATTAEVRYEPYDSSVMLGRATMAVPRLPPGFGELRVQVDREGWSSAQPRPDARVFLSRARRMVVPTGPTAAGEWPGVSFDSLGWATLGPAAAGAYELNARQLAFRSNRWPVVIRAGYVDTVRVRLLRETCDLAC